MKLQNMTPEVYYKESRDFSYISRMLEVMLNHMKTNADLVNGDINTIDSNDLLNSLAYTLGFKPKHRYFNKDLLNVCSNFAHIMKNKGTFYAVEECVKILLNSQHIIGDYVILPDYNNYIIQVGLPSETQDIVLLEDLFDYILPTGWVYNIVSISKFIELDTDIFYFNENINDEANPFTAKRAYGSIAQVSRPSTVDELKENITDITQEQGTSNNTEHSRLWSSIVYGKKLDLNENSNEENTNESEG